MLLVAKPGCEEKVLAICKKWELDAAVIGKVTDTEALGDQGDARLRSARAHEEAPDPVVVCDLPIPALTDDAPVYDRPRAGKTSTTRWPRP